MFKEYGCYGVGICLRGDNGMFVWFQGLTQPQEAEVCGLKEVLIWLGEMHLAAVSTYLDC
jgi:hypothetical protein